MKIVTFYFTGGPFDGYLLQVPISWSYATLYLLNPASMTLHGYIMLGWFTPTKAHYDYMGIAYKIQ